jgi:hypothetical protein
MGAAETRADHGDRLGEPLLGTASLRLGGRHLTIWISRLAAAGEVIIIVTVGGLFCERGLSYKRADL